MPLPARSRSTFYRSCRHLCLINVSWVGAGAGTRATAHTRITFNQPTATTPPLVAALAGGDVPGDACPPSPFLRTTVPTTHPSTRRQFCCITAALRGACYLRAPTHTRTTATPPTRRLPSTPRRGDALYHLRRTADGRATTQPGIQVCLRRRNLLYCCGVANRWNTVTGWFAWLPGDTLGI